jgi:hypothetical protein
MTANLRTLCCVLSFANAFVGYIRAVNGVQDAEVV